MIFRAVYLYKKHLQKIKTIIVKLLNLLVTARSQICILQIVKINKQYKIL